MLRDQGVSYQAYISQISYLLFLKMDEERATLIGEPSLLTASSRWEDIKEFGEALAVKYAKFSGIDIVPEVVRLAAIRPLSPQASPASK